MIASLQLPAFFKKVPVSAWVGASIVLLAVAAVASFPGTFGISTISKIEAPEQGEGFLLSTDFSNGKGRGRNLLFPELPVVFENGVRLARPMSSKKEITNAGRGRYAVSGSKIFFSTSDGGPVGERIYTIRRPGWSLHEPLLLGIWFLALTVSAISLRQLLPRGGDRVWEIPGTTYASLGLSAALIAAFILFRSFVSDGFFLGLLIPAVWAGLMGLLAKSGARSARIGLVVVSLMPALAGYWHYGLNGASDKWFLVGGVVPYSDARMHFQQAAEISIHGTTKILFNGRFLYPALLSVALDIARLNLLLANLIVSSLVMLGLAATARMVARRIGFAGTAIYCLLFWLYFRAHGCGLVMTENLGLLFGVVGFGFLLRSVDTQKIWPIFLSIAFFGLGSAARPGALFVLPALAFYAGLRVWMSGPRRHRVALASGAMILGLAVVIGCFGANQMVMKSLSNGEAKTFGNFAFSLHGLLNDTTWSTSANEFNWDTSAIMERNIRKIRESPSSLIKGIGRAYAEALKKGFLFRFGEERRLASAGMAAFFLALLFCWLWKPLRADAWWIYPLAAGLVASIPFAPPWDAGERPYAVTEPVQIFFAAAGAAMVLSLFGRLAELLMPGFGKETGIRSGNGFPAALPAFGILCLLLVIPVPLLLKVCGFKLAIPQESPSLIAGSRLRISAEGSRQQGSLPRDRYLDRLSDFQSVYPDEAGAFAPDREEFLLAMDWANLGHVVVPATAPLPITQNANPVP